ncbi:MAG: SRPBCC domain-containing protein, partial [Acidobacteriales bacterium]|nr:SRPBCC domain-containing protein [Terriglobales bacterium]
MADPELETSLHLRRTFAAPREQLFRAWTEPEALEKWFKPMGLTITVTTLELRVGGEYRFKLHGADGSHSEIAGTYLEIAPPARLVFTWVTEGTRGEQTIVTLEF